MDNFTFGRYSPYNTFIHKLDPRNKVFLMILLMVSIFLQFTCWSTNFIMSGLNLLFLIIIMIISKVSILEFIKNLRSLIFVIIFLIAIYIFIPNASYQFVMVDFQNGYKLYYDSLYQGGYIILRLVMMLLLTMILTSTCKPLDLTYAFEWYMSPLKVIKFPAHAIAMTISIALRFIPTLLDETNRIMKAQASRGVDFNKGGLIKKFKAVTSLIIPLLVSSFKRSEELANAMEARGYDPDKKRTRYRKLSFSYRDLIAFLITLTFFSGVLTLFIWNYSVGEINIIKFLFNVEPIF